MDSFPLLCLWASPEWQSLTLTGHSLWAQCWCRGSHLILFCSQASLGWRRHHDSFLQWRKLRVRKVMWLPVSHFLRKEQNWVHTPIVLLRDWLSSNRGVNVSETPLECLLTTASWNPTTRNNRCRNVCFLLIFQINYIVLIISLRVMRVYIQFYTLLCSLNITFWASMFQWYIAKLFIILQITPT